MSELDKTRLMIIVFIALLIIAGIIIYTLNVPDTEKSNNIEPIKPHTEPLGRS